ncbi:MAG TPA: transposase [Actinomycetes bacterium]|nr:transposase [Actinomycetes bacterium]
MGAISAVRAAGHQTCLAHLLRRCRELLDDAQRGQAKTPHAVRRILFGALAARDARDGGELDAAQTAAEAERLGVAVDRLLAGRTVYPPNRRLLDHLARERDALFTLLGRNDVQATNWRAGHAIRPAVVCRKAWGGNLTWRPGARESSAAHPAEGALPGDSHRPSLPSTARLVRRAVDGPCVVRPGPTARPWDGSGTGRGAGRSPPCGG